MSRLPRGFTFVRWGDIAPDGRTVEAVYRVAWWRWALLFLEALAIRARREKI